MVRIYVDLGRCLSLGDQQRLVITFLGESRLLCGGEGERGKFTFRLHADVYARRDFCFLDPVLGHQRGHQWGGQRPFPMGFVEQGDRFFPAFRKGVPFLHFHPDSLFQHLPLQGWQRQIQVGQPIHRVGDHRQRGEQEIPASDQEEEQREDDEGKLPMPHGDTVPYFSPARNQSSVDQRYGKKLD